MSSRVLSTKLTCCVSWRDARMTTQRFDSDIYIRAALFGHTDGSKGRSVFCRHARESFIDEEGDGFFAIHLLDTICQGFCPSFTANLRVRIPDEGVCRNLPLHQTHWRSKWSFLAGNLPEQVSRRHCKSPKADSYNH